MRSRHKYRIVFSDKGLSDAIAFKLIPKVHVIGSLDHNLTRTFDESHVNRKRLRDDFLNRHHSLLYCMTETAPPFHLLLTGRHPTLAPHKRDSYGINRITTPILQVQNVRPPTGGTILTRLKNTPQEEKLIVW